MGNENLGDFGMRLMLREKADEQYSVMRNLFFYAYVNGCAECGEERRKGVLVNCMRKAMKALDINENELPSFKTQYHRWNKSGMSVVK